MNPVMSFSVIGSPESRESVVMHLRKGYLVTPKKAILLLMAFVVSLVIVGLTVHYLSPDRRVSSELAGTSTLPPPTSSHSPSSSTPEWSTPPSSPPPNIRLPTSLSPTHYKLRLRPDFYDNDTSQFRFDGHVEIRFICVEATSQVALNAEQLSIDGANATLTENGSSDQTHWTVTKVELNETLQFVTFHFNKQLIVGKEFVLSVSYTGPIKHDMRGIYWSYYVENGVTKYLVTSQMEPLSARKVLPCFDEPRFKATYDVTLVRREHMTSLSNMMVVNSTSLSDGWVEDHFDRTVKMSSYLLAFTVCDFAFVEKNTSRGTRFRVYARRELIESARYGLDIGVKVHDFFEEYFNVTYPLPKQDMLAVPDFSSGAMENWGLIIYRETALLYDDNFSSTANRVRVAVVIAHELAHQWFGNLVTLAWWDDLWLNEGFASYFEYIGVDHAEPTWNFMRHFLISDLQYVMSTDSSESSHPIHFPVETNDLISSVFDSITYSKGASIIRMMQQFLGERTFRSGLQVYLKRLQYSNANYTDLWKALTEQSFEDGLQLNLSDVMDSWLKKRAYPVITVHVNTNNNTISVQQTRFFDDSFSDNSSDIAAEDVTWSLPFTYTTSVQLNWTNPAVHWIREKHGTLPLVQSFSYNSSSSSSSSWVIGNIGQVGYYRVNYEQKNWMNLISQLNSSHSVIPIENRAQIIDDAFQIGKAGLTDRLNGLQTTDYLHLEDEYVPWQAAISNLLYISEMLDRSAAFGHLEEYLLRKLVPVYNRLGWSSSNNDTADTRLLRSLVVKWTCFHGYRPCVAKASELSAKWMNSTDGAGIDADVKREVQCIGIREGGRAEWDFAFELYQSIGSADEKNRLLYALACSRTPWLLSRYLNYTCEKIRTQDTVAAFSHIARNPVGRLLAWGFFRNNWKLISERCAVRPSTLQRMFVSATSAFNTNQELDQLFDFPESTSLMLKVGADTYKQVVKTISANIRWMETNEANVSNWLQQRNQRRDSV